MSAQQPAASIVIERRFCGPPNSGNGGYVCGLLARHVEGEAEARLQRPPPLEQNLRVEREDAGALLTDGAEVIARAISARVELEVPTPPSLREAELASERFRHFEDHPFPTCFVCGPTRAADDGLRIFPGPLDAVQRVAALWTPDASLAEEGGSVGGEMVWAALDCPGGIASSMSRNRVLVLGSMSARIENPIKIGEHHVVLGWAIGAEGRKHYAGTAISSESGVLGARARATWIQLTSAP